MIRLMNVIMIMIMIMIMILMMIMIMILIMIVIIGAITKWMQTPPILRSSCCLTSTALVTLSSGRPRFLQALVIDLFHNNSRIDQIHPLDEPHSPCLHSPFLLQVC